MRLAAFFTWLGATLAAGCAHADHRTETLDAMEAELVRTSTQLRLPEYDPPYFVGFRVIDHRTATVESRFGGLVASDEDRSRRVAVDVRVGDYEFDSQPDASEFDFSEPPSFQPRPEAPIHGDVAGLRATMWLLADDAYKRALSNYLRKRAKKVTTVEEKHVDSFSQEAPAAYVGPERAFEVDRTAWEALAKSLSSRFRRPEGLALLDGSVRISGDHWQTHLVNSEGARIVKSYVLYSVSITAVSRAPDGMLLDQGETIYGRTWAEIADRTKLDALAAQVLGRLDALVAAPVADPYTGPAILAPRATGVFFHEAVGHRLEGERQKDSEEGGTYKGQIGVQILPEFISVRDDPTRQVVGDISLNGHYLYDDEGAKAHDTLLVDRGVLRAYLMSRTPVEDAARSNGHGRAQGIRRPVARMANLIVESRRTVPYERLKAMLLEEVKRQGKPYGLIIRDITGGSTNTSTYGYQAFKGVPRMVFRVDADTGEETLVRGVEIVGTPLTAVNKILATSDEADVFNGYCGAESGYVPVSTVAPATLFSEIELQRTRREKERMPLLPAPWVSVEPRGRDRPEEKSAP